MSGRIPALIGLLISSSIGGCPPPSQDSAMEIPSGPITVIEPSRIPAGTYSGEITASTRHYINGDIVDESTRTISSAVSFDANGIPLDSMSGEPERPGLSGSLQTGDLSITEVTQNVVAAGERVTVSYQARCTYANVPDIGTITLTGMDQAVYTLRADGALDLLMTSSLNSTTINGIGVYSIYLEATGVLAPGVSDTDNGSQASFGAPALENLSCPFQLNVDPLYTLSIPCQAIRAQESEEIPTADFEYYFFDDVTYDLYLVATFDPNTLPMYSAPSAVQTGSSLRYDGMMVTSAKDFLVVATGRLESGVQYRYAYGLLADGRMLMVGTGHENLFATAFFGSISLADTDGSNIGANPVAGVPDLLAPAPDGVIALDDNTVYRVSGISDLHRLLSWERGASVLVHDASYFSYSHAFFLTNREQWISVEANYVGVCSRSTIESVVDPEYGSVELSLADGSSWRVAFSDEGEAKTWKAGDEVAVVEDAESFLGHTMIRLLTGQTVVIEPN